MRAADLGPLYIHGDVDEDRPGPVGHGECKGLVHGLRHVDPPGGLGQRSSKSGDVGLLEPRLPHRRIRTQFPPVDLTRDEHGGHRVEVAAADPRQQVGRPGPTGRQGDTGSPGLELELELERLAGILERHLSTPIVTLPARASLPYVAVMIGSPPASSQPRPACFPTHSHDAFPDRRSKP